MDTKRKKSDIIGKTYHWLGSMLKIESFDKDNVDCVFVKVIKNGSKHRFTEGSRCCMMIELFLGNGDYESMFVPGTIWENNMFPELKVKILHEENDSDKVWIESMNNFSNVRLTNNYTKGSMLSFNIVRFSNKWHPIVEKNMLEVGQIWQHNKKSPGSNSSISLFEIIDVQSSPSDWVETRILEDINKSVGTLGDTVFWKIDEFKSDIFYKVSIVDIQTSEPNKDIDKNIIRCIECNCFLPDAEDQKGFRCWSCRNSSLDILFEVPTILGKDATTTEPTNATTGDIRLFDTTAINFWGAEPPLIWSWK